MKRTIDQIKALSRTDEQSLAEIEARVLERWARSCRPLRNETEWHNGFASAVLSAEEKAARIRAGGEA